MKPPPASLTRPDNVEPLLEVRDLSRHFRSGTRTVEALSDISFSLSSGGSLALTGRSGSGKSTLLNMIAGLDRPSGGTVNVAGRDLDKMNRRELAAHRASTVGIIFQAFQLIPHRTALQNVELAMMFSDIGRRQRRTLATESLERVGLTDRLDHKPDALSGGEKQRVAIARALVKQPLLLLADEPTGNLDRENTEDVASLLEDLNRNGQTLVLVSHDLELADRLCDTVLHLEYGKLIDSDGGRP